MFFSDTPDDVEEEDWLDQLFDIRYILIFVILFSYTVALNMGSKKID